MNFKILKSSHSRCGGMGSLLNLNKIPGAGRVSVQRSNSARECGVAGAVGGGVSIVNGNITKHSNLANTRNNNNANIHYTEANTDRGQVSGIYWLLNHFYYRMNLVSSCPCLAPLVSVCGGLSDAQMCHTQLCLPEKSQNLNIRNKIWR